MRNSEYRKAVAKSMGRVALAMWNLPISGSGEEEADELTRDAAEHLGEAYDCLHAVLCDDAVLGEVS